MPYAADFSLNELHHVIINKLNKPVPLLIDISENIDRKMKSLKQYKVAVTDFELEKVFFHSSRLGTYEGQFCERLWLSEI